MTKEDVLELRPESNFYGGMEMVDWFEVMSEFSCLITYKTKI